jgi:hypothetical protein
VGDHPAGLDIAEPRIDGDEEATKRRNASSINAERSRR